MLWIPALPLLAALAGSLLAPRLRYSPDRFAALCLQLGIGGPLLALLITLSATSGLFETSAPSHLSETVTTWLSVGTTTTLHLDLSLDPLAATAMVALFVLTLCTQFTAAGRTLPLLRVSAALGATLLLLLGESLLLVALGWHLWGLIAVSNGPCPGPGPEPRVNRGLRSFALGDAALWLAFAGLIYAAGAPNLGQIYKTALLGPGSRFAVLDLYGIALVPGIALCLTIAILLRLRACAPADLLMPHAEPDATVLHGTITPIIGIYLLLRLSSVLAIDSSALGLLAVLGSGFAVVATVRALMANSSKAAFVSVGHAQFGLVLVGVGVRAWVPALVLALVIATSQCSLQIAAYLRAHGSKQRPWTHLGSALAAFGASATTPLGALPPIALIAAAAWALQGAFALAALGIVVITGLLALVIARSHPKKSPVRSPDEPQIALATVSLGLLSLGLGVLCLPALLEGLTMGSTLAQNLPPATWTTLLQPALRLALVLAPPAPIDAGVLSGLIALLLVAAWFGAALGRQLGVPTARYSVPVLDWAARSALATLAAVVRLLRRSADFFTAHRARSYLNLWNAQGQARPQVVLALLFGISACLGVIYCNPSVVVIGPTAVHSVDLGGINPLISAPKRRKAKSPLQTSQTKPAEPTSGSIGGAESAEAVDSSPKAPPAGATQALEPSSPTLPSAIEPAQALPAGATQAVDPGQPTLPAAAGGETVEPSPLPPPAGATRALEPSQPTLPAAADSAASSPTPSADSTREHSK